ncbi:CARDB domain-containing protein [Halomontanus rarus]|uniref:CARDB domain-containing protein n=1 Tax=Halomontanus rarus TaxID=3034020 RepID=UPI0023E823E0|nr:CARDB domain-containing protein [Halovivax sp. TS33]
MSLTIPTGAVSLGVTQQADTTAHFELAPSTNPNSQYAEVQNGKIIIDMNGLSDRATTTANDVFTITATDDRLEAVWLSHEVDGITFYEDGDPNAKIDESNPLHLEPGETAHIGVSVDTHLAESTNGSFEIHVLTERDDRSSDISLEDVTLSQTDLTAGENLTVTATYENRGDATGIHTAELLVDGVVVDQQRVAVKPGKSQTVSFERTMSQTGTFEIGVDDAPTRTVTVRKPAKPAPDFVVSNATLEADSITAGESAVVSATVENWGNATGTMTAELAVGEYVVDTRRVELAPNESATVTFEWRFDGPGAYALAVSGTDAGSVTVTEPRSYAAEVRNLVTPTTAAVAPPLAVGAFFLVTAVNRRRDLWPVWHSDEADS